MSHPPTSRPAVARGVSRLAFDAVEQLTRMVEAMHANIAAAPLPLGARHGRAHARRHRLRLRQHPLRERGARGRRSTAGSACSPAGSGPALPAAALRRAAARAQRRARRPSRGDGESAGDPDAAPSRRRRAARAAAAAAVSCWCCARPVHERPPVGRGTVTTTAPRWRASSASRPSTCSTTAGRHVSENGRELAALLEALLARWPVPIAGARDPRAQHGRPGGAQRLPRRAPRPATPGSARLRQARLPRHAAPRRAARARRQLARAAARREPLLRAARAPGHAAQRRHHGSPLRQRARRRLAGPRPLRARVATAARRRRCRQAWRATRSPRARDRPDRARCPSPARSAATRSRQDARLPRAALLGRARAWTTSTCSTTPRSTRGCASGSAEPVQGVTIAKRPSGRSSSEKNESSSMRLPSTRELVGEDHVAQARLARREAQEEVAREPHGDRRRRGPALALRVVQHGVLEREHVGLAEVGEHEVEAPVASPSAFGPVQARGHRGEEVVERQVLRAGRGRGRARARRPARRGAARARRSGRRRATAPTRRGSRAGRRCARAARAPRRRPGSAKTRWSSSVAAQRYSPRSNASRRLAQHLGRAAHRLDVPVAASTGGSGSRCAGLPSYQPKYDLVDGLRVVAHGAVVAAVREAAARATPAARAARRSPAASRPRSRGAASGRGCSGRCRAALQVVDARARCPRPASGGSRTTTSASRKRSDRLVDVAAPEQRVAHLGAAQRVEVVQRVGHDLGAAARLLRPAGRR